MRRGLFALALLLCVVGMVWVLQGMNLLGGSYMSGDPFWAQMGVVLWLVGLGLLFLSRRGVG